MVQVTLYVQILLNIIFFLLFSLGIPFCTISGITGYTKNYCVSLEHSNGHGTEF